MLNNNYLVVAAMDSGMQDSSSHSDVPVQTDFGTTVSKAWFTIIMMLAYVMLCWDFRTSETNQFSAKSLVHYIRA